MVQARLTARAGRLTRAYTEVEVAGTTEAHVMMVPMGENALQCELERWLDTQPADGGGGS